MSPTAFHLLIRTRARVVLVLVIRVELDVLAHGEYTPRINPSGAPFTISAFVKDLSASVRRWMVRANRYAAFERQPVPVAPSELTAGPVKICTVLIGK
jgi:hypothetical protein